MLLGVVAALSVCTAGAGLAQHLTVTVTRMGFVIVVLANANESLDAAFSQINGLLVRGRR